MTIENLLWEPPISTTQYNDLSKQCRDLKDLVENLEIENLELQCALDDSRDVVKREAAHIVNLIGRVDRLTKDRETLERELKTHTPTHWSL